MQSLEEDQVFVMRRKSTPSPNPVCIGNVAVLCFPILKMYVLLKIIVGYINQDNRIHLSPQVTMLVFEVLYVSSCYECKVPALRHSAGSGEWMDGGVPGSCSFPVSLFLCHSQFWLYSLSMGRRQPVPRKDG